MKHIEQQKNRIFICTLSAIAVAVNASQEFKYARAHPASSPAVVRESQPPIRPEPVEHSPAAYSPPQPAIAPSQPVVSFDQPADQTESEVIEQPMAVPEQLRKKAPAFHDPYLAANATNQIFANEVPQTTNSVEPPHTESAAETTKELREARAARDDKLHQASMNSDLATSDSLKSQPAHYVSASSQKGATALMQKASASQQNMTTLMQKVSAAPVHNSPPSSTHHFVSSVVNAVFSPIRILLSPSQNTTASPRTHGSSGNTPSHSNSSQAKMTSSPHPSHSADPPAKHN